MRLSKLRTFNFQIEGQLSELSEVQFGALKELFSDGGTLHAHVRTTTDGNKEIHCAGFTDNIVKSLEDLCKWVSGFHQVLQKVQEISETAEAKLQKI